MTEEKEVFLTREGLKKLEEELDNLKNVRRKEVAERIKIAIGFGDLSENSEYDDAKNEQAFIEGTILDLENKLAHVHIIEDEDSDVKKVNVGSRVVVEDVELGTEEEYVIVGSMEADPLNNKISNESPLGVSIIGSQVGETVTVNAPAGPLQYKVVNIIK